MNVRMGITKIVKREFLFTLCFLAVVSGSLAQETSTLYFLPGIAQSLNDNPAIQNRSGKLITGIPFLSGISGQWKASVPFNALFYEGFDYSFHRLYDALDEQGKALATAGVSMFFTSFGHNRYSFSLSVKDRIFSEFYTDREIVRFIRDGTQSYYGTNENMGSATFFLTNFREVAPGFSKRINDQLDIGFRPKLLFGRFHFQTVNLNFSIQSNLENEYLNLSSIGSFSLSGPYSHIRDSIRQTSTFRSNVSPGDYFFHFRNLGIALDAGVIYRPGRFTEISASLLDIGMIGFRHNAFNVDFNRPLRFNRSELYQSVDQEGEGTYREPRMALIDLSDSTSYIMNVEETDKRKITYLPFRMNLAGKYIISKKLSAGFSNQFTHHRYQSTNLLSTFLTTAIFPGFDIYGSLSLLNSNAVLPGFGVCHTSTRLQVFFTSNNIWGIIHPASSNNLNLCFGINFLFDTE